MEERIYINTREGETERDREGQRDLYADNNFTKLLIVGYAPKKQYHVHQCHQCHKSLN